jgi:CheY-like chemotaxis protein/class 3 adenylate cyclase
MDSASAIPGVVDLFSKTSTFVSIDVVDSTSLKAGTNEQDVIYTFLSYHKLVRELAYQHHGEIITISGDGMMCRFERAEDAAGAVKSVLQALPAFNKRQNRLSRGFALRLGVNTGQVFESQSLTPGQLISRTIDVAAKLQQGCQSNHARFSQETVNLLKNLDLPLAKMGWDAKLQTTAYEYSPNEQISVAPRVMPNPVKVLLVEDDLTTLVKLRKLLWARHHDVLPVYSAAQAAQCTLSWAPHLIMVDADLAWCAGWDLVKGLRADASASRIPVIMLSQEMTGDTVDKCFGLGANGLVKKPLEEQQVVKRLEMILREFYL